VVLQRGTVQILHRNEGSPVFFANLVNGANVGMIQCRCCLRFPAEALERLMVSCNIIRQELQCDESVE